MDKLDALLDVLDSSGLQADAEELADALWLGLRMVVMTPNVVALANEPRADSPAQSGIKHSPEKPQGDKSETPADVASPAQSRRENSVALRAQGPEPTTELKA